MARDGVSSRTRPPAVAGKFYPADPVACGDAARQLVAGPGGSAATTTTAHAGRLFGGLVPHAGWVASGAIAGQTIAALRVAGAEPDVVVVFGAVHTPRHLAAAALDSFDAWDEPTGLTEVATDVRRALASRGGKWFEVDDAFHRGEHAVEVELPLIRAAWPGAKVLPVEVPAEMFAVDVGVATARAVADAGHRVVFLASSDLTHYGPAYDFAPACVGEPGLAWAKRNDERVLRLVTEMRADAVVPEVRASGNACGGGAIAALLAACTELGATRATLLRHASSYETLADVAPQPPTNAVGYASVVVG